MEQLDFSREEPAGEKRTRSDEATSAGDNNQKKKREKLVAQKAMAIKSSAPPLREGENVEEEDDQSMDTSSDDDSGVAPIDVEADEGSYHEKKAQKAADREKYWLDMVHEPIKVHPDTTRKGKSIKYSGNSKYTIAVVDYDRNVKDPRVFTSCIKVIRNNLLKDKAIDIVPGMICKLAEDGESMLMIHSIQLKLARPHR